ncbi:SUKH-3 domain-containing protein [Lentzea albida]|uniref:SUKH-3 immunity protein n=1 Tax=Lentzea albida TaxID=65499 RepID=A0A1H9VUP8_9PSEU|nr:SUKH-3 domain-containing protein [Lentzea albida]SES25312.1 SUKH-3 immunity protein [Lentzea albida]
MTHYPDLSPYSYFPSRVPMVNVGWLDPPHDFPTGPAPDELVEALWLLAEEPRNVARGLHFCGFCEGARFDDLPLGTGEIHVDAGGVRHSAPRLVGHYVRDHGYLPPQAFSDAAVGRFRDLRARTRELLETAGWVQGRSVDTSAWRRAFPSLGWHDGAERFLAEFGGLTLRGVETVVLDPLRCAGAVDLFERWKKVREVVPAGVAGDHLLGVGAGGELVALSGDGHAWMGSGSSAIRRLSEGQHLDEDDG